MRKTIFSAILILSTMSCAAFMEDFGEGKYDVAIQQTAVALALTSKPAVRRNDLLLGLYYYSLIATPPQDRYFYRPLSARSALDLAWLSQIRPKYDYLPPPTTLNSIYRSLWIESALDDELRNYEDELWWINFREKMKLESEVDELIRKLKRAKED